MVILLFRRNTLRRLISVLANNYDRRTKQLNGIHKSHVHSKEEVWCNKRKKWTYRNSKRWLIWYPFALTENYLIWFSLKSIPSCPYLLLGQAEILATFKPKMDVSTLIPSIRNAEHSMRTCLGHFRKTRHMILYYEDVIRDKNVVITNKRHSQPQTSSKITHTTYCFFVIYAGIVPGAGIPRSSGDQTVQPACEDPHQAPPGPRRELGGCERDAERDKVYSVSWWRRLCQVMFSSSHQGQTGHSSNFF